jgi:hypothetical protein
VNVTNTKEKKVAEPISFVRYHCSLARQLELLRNQEIEFNVKHFSGALFVSCNHTVELSGELISSWSKASHHCEKP